MEWYYLTAVRKIKRSVTEEGRAWINQRHRCLGTALLPLPAVPWLVAAPCCLLRDETPDPVATFLFPPVTTFVSLFWDLLALLEAVENGGVGDIKRSDQSYEEGWSRRNRAKIYYQQMGEHTKLL